uniref:Uncharacterized protein n=1 Tax=Strombidium inclinatum TaxID=197538 RepID=A0A7S3MZC2_9SPIT|mmetsp:Transcript_24738/g.38517  ORF Transcript_24738/g.38517 Transcript_24738/m.38517 type:complete len:112 (+) Transcript_24738:427-762(+)
MKDRLKMKELLDKDSTFKSVKRLSTEDDIFKRMANKQMAREGRIRLQYASPRDYRVDIKRNYSSKADLNKLTKEIAAERRKRKDVEIELKRIIEQSRNGGHKLTGSVFDRS